MVGNARRVSGLSLMRILHILDHSLPVQSGYVYRTLGILREQAALGWQTMQLTTPKQPSANGAEVTDGWRFHRTPRQPDSPWMPRILREHAVVRATARRLEELARAWRPDVIHAHSPVLTAWAGLSVGRKLGIPLVYEVRALWEDAAASHGTLREGGPGYMLARRLETHAVRRADAVVTISWGLHRELCARGAGAADIFVVPNAVDVTRFVPEERAGAAGIGRVRHPVVGFIGSLYAYEGLDLLLQAAERIVVDRPGTRFMVIGGGRDEVRLRQLHASGNLGDRLILTGWIPHDRIVESYREIDIFVYPRRRNRLTELVTPLKPLEAMAMAKVVLASDVGGHRELIDHGRTGFLFKADDVSDLVFQLRALLEASHTWPAIGRAARQFVERERAWKAVASTYARVYERALSGRGDAEGRDK
jgi:glycogen synthase